MIHTVLAFVLAGGAYLQAPDPDPDQVLDQYETTCAAKPDRPACAELRQAVQRVFYEDLRMLTAGGSPVDRGLLRVAANSDSLPLRELGLHRLSSGTKPRDLTAEERALFQAELNSPYPALRRHAWRAFGLLTRGNRGQKLGVRQLYRTPFAADEPGPPRGLMPQRVPLLAFGAVHAYPDAEFLAYASGPDGSVFFTADAPEKVVKFYAELGTPEPMGTLAEQVIKALQPDMDAMSKEMQKLMASGEDPATIAAKMKELQARMTGPPPGLQWVSDVAGWAQARGIENLRVIRVHKKNGDPISGLTSAVIVWRDTDLNKTGLAVVHVLPKTEAP